MTNSMAEYGNIRFVASLFEREVPEYRNGVVVLVAVARQPGVRTKVAVASEDLDVDPVEACVGPDGARIRAIVAGLGGEVLDVVPYDEDPVRFVCNALAPAPIKRVFVDDENQTMELLVEDPDFERVMKWGGVNVRLAAQLTGWRLDVMSESQLAAMRSRLHAELPGVDFALVERVFGAGYYNVEQLATAAPEEVADFVGVETDDAVDLIRAARKRS